MARLGWRRIYLALTSPIVVDRQVTFSGLRCTPQYLKHHLLFHHPPAIPHRTRLRHLRAGAVAGRILRIGLPGYVRGVALKSFGTCRPGRVGLGNPNHAHGMTLIGMAWPRARTCRPGRGRMREGYDLSLVSLALPTLGPLSQRRRLRRSICEIRMRRMISRLVVLTRTPISGLLAYPFL